MQTPLNNKAFSQKNPQFFTGTNISSIEEIDAITNAEEHIRFVTNLIQKHSIFGERQDNLFRQLYSIDRRVKDSTLYLAVLGEFSSGKSTFINGLLRKRLLKASRVATTASATYISYGDEFSVNVTFLDDSQIQATESNTSELYQAISQIKSDLPKQFKLQELINLLTSDRDVADGVKRINISLPEESLKFGLSIIDTPGIGAGAEYTNNHANVTQTVIEESADAAIILIPSSSPMSETLISFLQTTASHFLHRCIFIITAMDDQEEEERESIINFVKQKLETKLGLVNPVVLESAAITMLPIPQIPPYKKGIWSYWQKQFQNLESILLQEMYRQRNVIISERLVYLLQEIFLDLNQDIKDKQKKLTEEEQYLNANSVTAIEEVLGRLFEQGTEKISRQGDICKSKAISKSRKFRTKTKDQVNEIIIEAGWEITKNYEDSVEPKIKSEIKTESKKFIKKVNKDIKVLRESCEEVSSEFKHQFERNYQNLKALGVNIKISDLTTSSLNISSLNFSSPKSFIKQVNKEDNQRAGGGAVIGGIIGTFLLPGIGTAAGSAIGAFIGYGSGNDLETCRQGVKSRVGNDVDKYVDKYLSEVQSKINHFVQNATSDLDDAVEEHLSKYGAVVNKMLAEHNRKKEQLKIDILEVNCDSKELSYRKQKLETLHSNLLQV
ncbi:MAG: dynamin family protein [Xenococcus sp. MO_188.B8]|nr:dynamin family protein [Xenococcus sp. MO_188.B8]